MFVGTLTASRAYAEMTQGTNHDQLVASQKARAQSTSERILDAMKTIESEIAQHGHYLENNGSVTLTEVARRANVSAITLRNKHHHETRAAVLQWLKRLKEKSATTKTESKQVIQKKIAFLENALRKMESEALKWRVEVTALAEENKTLREEIRIYKNSQ
jgi:hypothetical protein